MRQYLRQGQLSMAEGTKVSSLHVTFCNAEEYEEGRKVGWLQRLGVQFHFPNRGYRDFSDFTAQLSARKRKAVLKERREGQKGLKIEALNGSDLKEEHLDLSLIHI